MKMCDAHREELRRELTEHGLGAYMAGTPEEALKRSLEMVNAPSTAEYAASFEPYGGAFLRMCNIVRREDPVKYVLAGDDVCPACAIIDMCKCGHADCEVRQVVHHVADEAVATARHVGLMKPAN